MGIWSYATTFFQLFPYRFLPRCMQLRVQQHRLNGLLKYAKANSPYYRQAIPDDFSFSGIPSIDKQTFVERFDAIVTDPRVTYDRVSDLILHHTQGLAKIDGKYTVTLTSGSTGKPTVVLQDDFFQDMTSISSFLRAYYHSLPVVVIVAEDSGFSVSSAMLRKNLKMSKLIRSAFHFIIAEKTSVDDMICMLQKIGPASLTGYTGVMTLLSKRIAEKGLKIKEKQILLSGEGCSDLEKEIIRKGFDCKKIDSLYACTEGGTLAYACKCGHMHIAADIVKLEPVDSNNNPVDYEVQSDKVLLTNLMNRIQPIIRYELTDRIILHRADTCSCGCKDDWLEIEGRTEDNAIFDTPSGEVTVPALVLLSKFSDVSRKGLSLFWNYQVVGHRDGRLDVTLDYAPGAEPEVVNRLLEEKLKEYLCSCGVIDVKICFIPGEMKKTHQNKYKHFYMADEDNLP